jgi:hypothetical protein
MAFGEIICKKRKDGWEISIKGSNVGGAGIDVEENSEQIGSIGFDR